MKRYIARLLALLTLLAPAAAWSQPNPVPFGEVPLTGTSTTFTFTTTRVPELSDNQVVARWVQGLFGTVRTTGNLYIDNPLFGDIGVQTVGNLTYTIASGAWSYTQVVRLNDMSWCCRNGTPNGTYIEQSFDFASAAVLDLAGSPLSEIGSHEVTVSYAANLYIQEYAAHLENAEITFRNTYFLSGVVERAEGAVPEPSTWLTMILGIGLVGYATRRSRTLFRSTVGKV